MATPSVAKAPLIRMVVVPEPGEKGDGEGFRPATPEPRNIYLPNVTEF